MTLLAVLVGGILGTGLRLGISAVLLPDDPFPWATLLINVVGSFALAVLVARVWPTAPAWLRAGLGTGVLGSFTTFSALVVSLLTMSRDGMVGLAALYLGVSLLGGLAAALLGLRLGSRVTPNVTPALQVDE